jgi:hypothetical protein
MSYNKNCHQISKMNHQKMINIETKLYSIWFEFLIMLAKSKIKEKEQNLKEIMQEWKVLDHPKILKIRCIKRFLRPVLASRKEREFTLIQTCN